MERCIIAVSSITYGMKGQQLLANDGITGEVIKLQANRTRRGCAYGIAVPCHVQHAATRLLSHGRIPFSEVLHEDYPTATKGTFRDGKTRLS